MKWLAYVSCTQKDLAVEGEKNLAHMSKKQETKRAEQEVEVNKSPQHLASEDRATSEYTRCYSLLLRSCH